MILTYRGNWLKRAFDMYNRAYFKNKLPHDTTVEWKYLGGDMGWQVDKYIYVDRRLKQWKRIALATLLHEMAHLDLPPQVFHGPQFVRRMRRLVAQGAFDNLL